MLTLLDGTKSYTIKFMLSIHFFAIPDEINIDTASLFIMIYLLFQAINNTDVSEKSNKILAFNKKLKSYLYKR